MKVSSAHEVNLPIDNVEVELLQQGGRVKLLDVAEMKKKGSAVPSKTDNTKVKGVLKAKPGKPDYYRDQGTISAYDKSPREKLMSSMHKLANVGDGAVTGLVAQPILSGARLLRADKYFDGVDSDAKLGSAVGNMAMDALMVLPAAKPLRALGVEAKGLARAGSEAIEPYVDRFKQTYNATADITNPLKRVENSFWSSTTTKNLAGDQTGRNYFNMTPDQAGSKMSKELVNSKPGMMHTETSLSANSSPLFWNQLARGKKDWKVVRPGGIQEVNLSGMNGKRIEAAIPKQVQTQFREMSNEAKAFQKDIAEQYKAGKINKETYEANKLRAENITNHHMVNHMMEDNLAGGKYYDQFMQNYKPTMDAGIKSTNAKTGLNFPMTTIDGIQYSQPSAQAIHKPWQRAKLVGRDVIQGTRNNYIINKELRGATGEYAQQLGYLKSDNHWAPNMSRDDLRFRMRYARDNSNRTEVNLDELYNDYADIDVDTSGPSAGDLAMPPDRLSSLLRRFQTDRRSLETIGVGAPRTLSHSDQAIDQMNSVGRSTIGGPAALPAEVNLSIPRETRHRQLMDIINRSNPSQLRSQLPPPPTEINTVY